MFERSAGTTAFRQFPRLADQHWITTMIAHLEGLDQIATRREQLGAPGPRGRRRQNQDDGQDGGGGDTAANAKAKGKAAPR